MAKHTATDSSTKRPAPKARMLVIDDTPDQLELIQEVVRQTFDKVELVCHTKPEEAIAYLEDCLQMASGLPQLIVLDLYLPTRQMGLQLLERIRSMDEPVCHLPIMMLSSSADGGDIQQAYEQGANTYVIKPADLQQWLVYFQAIKEYWWNTVSLPSRRYV